MNALRKLIHHVFGFSPESRSKANADQDANWRFAPDADHNGTNAVLPPDADQAAFVPFAPDADKPGAARPVSDDKRARNLAKLEARKAEAAAKHRATMATRPGARS